MGSRATAVEVLKPSSSGHDRLEQASAIFKRVPSDNYAGECVNQAVYLK